MTDASTPAQRSNFTNSIEAGAPNMTFAVAVANSQYPMTDAECLLLDMPVNSTMAAGAAKLQLRAAGQVTVY